MPVLPVRGRNGSERAGSGPRGHVRTGAGKGRAPYRCIPIRKMEAVLARPGQSGTRVSVSKSAKVQLSQGLALARLALSMTEGRHARSQVVRVLPRAASVGVGSARRGGRAQGSSSRSGVAMTATLLLLGLLTCARATRHDGLQSKTVPSHTSIGGREKGRGGLIPVSDRSLSLEGTSGRGLRCDPDAPKVGPQRLSVWVAISLFWNELAVTSMYIAVIAAGGSRKVARGIIM